MARVLHDITASHGLLKAGRDSALRALRRLFSLKEREEFRLSYVDQTHAYVRNRTRTVAFLHNFGLEEVRKIFSIGVGRVYVTAEYHPRDPRKTFKILEHIKEKRDW